MPKSLAQATRSANLAETPSRVSQPGSIALPADRSTATRPAIVDRLVDFDMRRLWRELDTWGKPTAIARALTADERSAIERRRRDLLIGTAPFTDAEESTAVAAMSRMLGGFRSLRHEDDESVVAALHALRYVLSPFPIWAIEAGCLAIARGEAVIGDESLNRKFPPNDSEIYAVVKQIVKPYLQAITDAEWLLTAPIITKVARREPAAPALDQPQPAQPTAEEADRLPTRRFVTGQELDGWRVVARILAQSELPTQANGEGVQGIWMVSEPEADLITLHEFVDQSPETWQIVEEGGAKFGSWRDRIEVWTGKRPLAQKIWLEPRDPAAHGLAPSHPNFRLRSSASGFRVPSPWPPHRDGTWKKPEMTNDDLDALASEGQR
jgi:hypothetical protein